MLCLPIFLSLFLSAIAYQPVMQAEGSGLPSIRRAGHLPESILMRNGKTNLGSGKGGFEQLDNGLSAAFRPVSPLGSGLPTSPEFPVAPIGGGQQEQQATLGTGVEEDHRVVDEDKIASGTVDYDQNVYRRKDVAVNVPRAVHNVRYGMDTQNIPDVQASQGSEARRVVEFVREPVTLNKARLERYMKTETKYVPVPTTKRSETFHTVPVQHPYYDVIHVPIKRLRHRLRYVPHPMRRYTVDYVPRTESDTEYEVVKDIVRKNRLANIAYNVNKVSLHQEPRTEYVTDYRDQPYEYTKDVETYEPRYYKQIVDTLSSAKGGPKGGFKGNSKLV